MAEGERSGVPLKRRCSRTWDAPAWSWSSSREPVPTQKPMHTDRASSIRSVARDRPDGRTSVRIMGARWSTPSAGRAGGGRPSGQPPAGRTRSTAPATTSAAPATTTGSVGRLDHARAQIAELLDQLHLECLLERGSPGRYAGGRRRPAPSTGVPAGAASFEEAFAVELVQEFGD